MNTLLKKSKDHKTRSRLAPVVVLALLFSLVACSGNSGSDSESPDTSAAAAGCAATSIFWLKERGLMPGLCMSNEFISRDESLHTEFAVLLYSMIKNKLSQNDIHRIIKEAVTIEMEFITESIPCNLLGMNADLMKEYIKFIADRLVVQLGYEKIYEAKNPFPFMDRINLEHKTNFFIFLMSYGFI